MNPASHIDKSLPADSPPTRAIPDDEPVGLNDRGEWARALIATRRNVSPKRLVEPGPHQKQLEQIFAAAAAAPDHAELTPWRFIIVPQGKRCLLAEAFALALIDRDPGATLVQIEAAREKAYRAPFLMLALGKLPVDAMPDIPDQECVVSLGCAIQNMLLLTHAMGYGGGLTSGKAMASRRLRELFRLARNETPVCFINIGTVSTRKPGRVRPVFGNFVSSL